MPDFRGVYIHICTYSFNKGLNNEKHKEKISLAVAVAFSFEIV